MTPRFALAHTSLIGACAAMFLVASAPVVAAGPDVRVSVGSPTGPFPRNKQNEPALAVDVSHPNVLVAGANDEIDVELCKAGDPATCPFTPGVGVSGVYFSFDSGHTWTQPTYTGWSARNCDTLNAPCEPGLGDIGTLPWYYENGLASDGDPSVAFGPRRGSDGKFSWDNGSRLYYANLAANWSENRKEQGFKGFEAIAVSRSDNVEAAAAGDKDAWMPPVIVTKQNAALFSDKESIWADNAASSRHFGNVYLCNVAFRGAGRIGGEPVMFARSTDGGDTWKVQQITQAAPGVSLAGRAGSRQGCMVRTDSKGTVYVVWDGGLNGRDVQYLARSFNGGVSFERPRAVASQTEVGVYDPVQQDWVIDGVTGARTNSFPSIDIANGAPSGTGAPDTIVLAWADGLLNHEKALVQMSTDGGQHWSTPVDATEAGDRVNFPAVGISPDGQMVYITYNAFLQDFQSDNTTERKMVGVLRRAAANTLTPWSTRWRSSSLDVDARGSSANALSSEFLGDYNSIIVTSTYAFAVWNDVRNASSCDAINDLRDALATDSDLPDPLPEPNSDCATTFGNTDIYGVNDPLP